MTAGADSALVEELRKLPQQAGEVGRAAGGRNDEKVGKSADPRDVEHHGILSLVVGYQPRSLQGRILTA